MNCHKCGHPDKKSATYPVYTNADGWVRLCRNCAKDRPVEYLYPVRTKRRLGDKIPTVRQAIKANRKKVKA